MMAGVLIANWIMHADNITPWSILSNAINFHGLHVNNYVMQLQCSELMLHGVLFVTAALTVYLVSFLKDFVEDEIPITAYRSGKTDTDFCNISLVGLYIDFSEVKNIPSLWGLTDTVWQPIRSPWCLMFCANLRSIRNVHVRKTGTL